MKTWGGHTHRGVASIAYAMSTVRSATSINPSPKGGRAPNVCVGVAGRPRELEYAGESPRRQPHGRRGGGEDRNHPPFGSQLQRECEEVWVFFFPFPQLWTKVEQMTALNQLSMDFVDRRRFRTAVESMPPSIQSHLRRVCTPLDRVGRGSKPRRSRPRLVLSWCGWLAGGSSVQKTKTRPGANSMCGISAFCVQRVHSPVKKKVEL